MPPLNNTEINLVSHFVNCERRKYAKNHIECDLTKICHSHSNCSALLSILFMFADIFDEVINFPPQPQAINVAFINLSIDLYSMKARPTNSGPR